MSGHTQEPWAHGGTAVSSKEDLIRIFGESVDVHVGDVGQYFLEIYTEKGKRIAFLAGPTAHANARRIIACVDACQGIETDVLEVTHGLDAIYNDIQRRRDLLLAAMKKLSGMKLNMIADGIVDKAIKEAEQKS